MLMVLFMSMSVNLIIKSTMTKKKDKHMSSNHNLVTPLHK